MGRPPLDVEVNRELSRLFRERGYDGLSLSAFEQASGMAKASLYYRFPDGKDSMARAAIDSVTEEFAALALELEQLPPDEALRKLQRTLLAYYDNGRLGCLLGAFAVPNVVERFRDELQALYRAFARTINAIQRDSALTSKDKHRRTEDFIVDLEGSLIFAAVSGQSSAFSRRLKAALARLDGV